MTVPNDLDGENHQNFRNSDAFLPHTQFHDHFWYAWSSDTKPSSHSHNLLQPPHREAQPSCKACSWIHSRKGVPQKACRHARRGRAQGQGADRESGGDRASRAALLPPAGPDSRGSLHGAGRTVAARAGGRGESVPGQVHARVHQRCQAAGSCPVHWVRSSSPLHSPKDTLANAGQ